MLGYRNMAQYAHLSTPDPEYEQIFKSSPRLPPPKDIDAVRQLMDVILVGIVKEHYRPLLPDGTAFVSHCAVTSE